MAFGKTKDFDLEKIEWAYNRFHQLADNHQYRLIENKTKKRNDEGKEYEDIYYDIRCNSRVIVSYIKSKTDAESLTEKLNKSCEVFLKEEYDLFKKSI